MAGWEGHLPSGQQHVRWSWSRSGVADGRMDRSAGVYLAQSLSHSRKEEVQGSWHSCVTATSTSAILGAGQQCTWGPGKAAPGPAEQG